MNAPNIFVTGGAGFVGASIIRAIKEKYPDWAVTVFDLNLPSHDAPNVNYLSGDITRMDSVMAAMEQVKPNVVIHTAGLVPSLASRYGRKDRDKIFNVNVEGTKNMLVAARRLSVEAFVWTGSCCCVTDDMKYQYANVDESWPTSSQSLIYGESKTAAETLVLAASDEKLATCSLRPSVLFGEEDYQLIPSIHACIAKGETPFVIGTGLNMWDVTYVNNIADAHVLAVENLTSTKSAAGQAFFISNNEPVPFRDFCLAIWAHFGHYPQVEIRIPTGLATFVGYLAEKVTWLTGTATTLNSGSVMDACGTRYCDGSKAKEILGYEPRVSIVEGLRRSCDAYAQRSSQNAVARSTVEDEQKNAVKTWVHEALNLCRSFRKRWIS